MKIICHIIQNDLLILLQPFITKIFYINFRKGYNNSDDIAKCYVERFLLYKSEDIQYPLLVVAGCASLYFVCVVIHHT